MEPRSADAILAMREPEQLFTSPATAKSEHRELLKIWHPDINADERAADVSARINELYLFALRRIEAGTWHTPGLLEIVGMDGGKRRVRYRMKHAFELGEMVYGDTVLAFLVNPEHADLFKIGRERLARLAFRDDHMRKEMARFLPKVLSTFEAQDGRHVMVQEKTPDVFLLRDVLAALGGEIDARHVAWIGSAFHNIACYLEWARLTHNGISIDTCFVSPKMHSGLLLGGWWYSAEFGTRLKAVPEHVYRFAPPDILRAKRAEYRLDLTLLRTMLRELLGDATGMTLAAAGKSNKPMVDFLRRPTSGSAREDYAHWGDKVLRPASAPGASRS